MLWMMSNRQPWVEAVVSGITNFKTRSWAVNLPPVGSIVLLHASQALWQNWRGLQWAKDLDVKNLPRGAVCGIARVVGVGITDSFDLNLTPFNVYGPTGTLWYNCADMQSIIFDNVRRLTPFECKGTLTPTKKIDPEIVKHFSKTLKWYEQNVPELF